MSPRFWATVFARFQGSQVFDVALECGLTAYDAEFSP